jgi:hypothetical protein
VANRNARAAMAKSFLAIEFVTALTMNGLETIDF